VLDRSDRAVTRCRDTILGVSKSTPSEAGELVIEATRRMLKAVCQAEIADEPVNPTSAEAVAPIRVMNEILASSQWDAMTQYVAIALLSISIKWASDETGKQPEQILDELASKFRSPD